jgi:hypothetical protein
MGVKCWGWVLNGRQGGAYWIDTDLKGVVAEWIRTPNSSSGASVQQSVGLNLGFDTCVLEQDTLL